MAQSSSVANGVPLTVIFGLFMGTLHPYGAVGDGLTDPVSISMSPRVNFDGVRTMARLFSTSRSVDGTLQNSVYIGINIENILYGIELVLYFKTLQILAARKRCSCEKSDHFYAVFSSIMLLSVTVWAVTQALFGEEMWILQSDYPEGPDAYWEKNISVWYMDFGTTLIVILQLMTDGLMIYRCRVIWGSNRVIIVPALLWLSTLVLSLFVDWSSSIPGGDFYTGVSSRFVLWYYAVSVVLNVILTGMICCYIMRHGRQVEKGLGKEYASTYFSVVTIVVESAAPYTLSGIAFLVSLGLGSPTSVAFACVYFMMMCISPQMLILRVLMGRTWDKDTCRSSSLVFNPVRTSGSQWKVARVQLRKLSNVYVPDGRDDKGSLSLV